MNSRPRYVFDSNVIISALLFNHSVPGQAFFRILRDGHLLMSRDLAEELRHVLSRDKFDRYLTRDERERLLVALIRQSEIVQTSSSVRVCRDPDDNAVLELAVDGHASFVVTGDRDLLVLDRFQGVRIVTPAQLLEWLAKEGKPDNPS